MFRLPSRSIKSNHSNNTNQVFQQAYTYYPQPSQIDLVQPKYNITPPVHHSSILLHKKNRPFAQQIKDSASKTKKSKNYDNLTSGVLISPSNKRYISFTNVQQCKNMYSKMTSSDFLLEPCKLKLFHQNQIKIERVKSLIRPKSSTNQSYCGQKIKFKEGRWKKSASTKRENYTMSFYLSKKKNSIEPWDTSERFNQSLNLNSRQKINL